MTRHSPAIVAAITAWEAGARRLDELGPAQAARRRIVDAVCVELRRRVGSTFALADLVRAYEDAASWYTELAARTAPASPEAWDAAVALDGAFALYARGATREAAA